MNKQNIFLHPLPRWRHMWKIGGKKRDHNRKIPLSVIKKKNLRLPGPSKDPVGTDLIIMWCYTIVWLKTIMNRDMTKPTKWVSAQSLIRLGGCPCWSESLLGAHSFCLFCHVVALIAPITVTDRHRPLWRIFNDFENRNEKLTDFVKVTTISSN